MKLQSGNSPSSSVTWRTVCGDASRSGCPLRFAQMVAGRPALCPPITSVARLSPVCLQGMWHTW